MLTVKELIDKLNTVEDKTAIVFLSCRHEPEPIDKTDTIKYLTKEDYIKELLARGETQATAEKGWKYYAEGYLDKPAHAMLKIYSCIW